MSDRATGHVRIGTSGWSYEHWRGPFYPHDLPGTRMLEFYAQRFGTVEVNSSFYRLPAHETLEHWRRNVPETFVFAVKASRYITHMKKLGEPAATSRKFLHRITGLDAQLGPVLFQLPPRWRVDVERLKRFLEALPALQRYAFELRDRSWHDERVYGLLESFNCAACLYELEGFESPERRTADFMYVRLHGPVQAYAGSYDDDALSLWAERISAWSAQGLDVYCYFDNDEQGYAAENAARLQTMLGARLL